MRRIDLPVKPCAHCKGPVFRVRRANGRLEPPTAYAKRRYCSPACYARKRTATTPSRECRHCGSTLTRKRWPTGQLEPTRKFRARRWCDLKCQALWFEDPLNAARYGAEMKRRQARTTKRIGGPRRPATERRGARTRCEWCTATNAAPGDILCTRCEPIVTERLAA